MFKNMRRKVRAYVRTLDICQRGKADTHLPRGMMGHLEIPARKIVISVGGLHLVARDEVEEFGGVGRRDADSDRPGDYDGSIKTVQQSMECGPIGR